MLEDLSGGNHTKFGEYASKIWTTLNEKSPLKKEEIIKMTHLHNNDFQIGVGWLARENKISMNNEGWYKLENTNLTYTIGTNAGKIWKIMDIWGKTDYLTIKKLTKLNQNEIYPALGWLAREDKINVDEKQRYYLK